METKFFILLFWLGTSLCDFVYKDFNSTTGLKFVGSAGTTNCFNSSINRYGDYQMKADSFNENLFIEYGESTDFITESIIEANIEIYNKEIDENLAGFLHRTDTISAPMTCEERVRLTPSGPSKVGAIWFQDNVPVLNGFDTYFVFQISDHSKECVLVKDQYFSKIHHRTCSVHGGDGLAFVIQQNSNSTETFGENGGQMGFGGIKNSIAIAFDTWTNPGEDQLNVDHVSIQSRGTLPNDALEAGLLGVPRAATLADGQKHLVRITYYGDLRTEYFDKLVASPSLLPFLNDNGEQKRVGTLLVYLDEGIESDVPLMAMPINLSLLLDLPDSKASVGFTASTGRFYEKHDLLSWYWCDQEPCDDKLKVEFDYHQKSRFSSTPRRKFVPGAGFGGGDNLDFPTKNKDQDTSPWELPLQHFSAGRNVGLDNSALLQTPPHTLY